MSILAYVPAGWTLRPEQRELLLGIESGWKNHDVFVVLAPTAVGKSLLAYVVAQWAASKNLSTNIMPPTNVLVEQLAETFPDLEVMRRKGAYHCADFKQDCETTIEACDKPCSDCPYVKAKRDARKAKVRLMNPYVMWAQKLHSQVVIFDEGHTLIDMLQDKQDVKLWRGVYEFPSTLKTVADVVTWGQNYLTRKPDAKLQDAIRQIIKIKDGASVQYRRETLRGKMDTMLHVLPSTTRLVPPWLWPQGKVEKILLMSATIGEKDIAELGLAKRKVMYLQCGSPIPAANRPFIYESRCNMALRYRELAMPHFAKAVREKLVERPEKGLIHLPYAAVELFAQCIDDPRLMFHNRDNKSEVLERFKESPPEHGRVLVASGLFEGIDLPFDQARWQVIGCVPYLSLGDERIRRKAEEDPLWYAWETIKRILQAAGRIVRSTDDYGLTMIFDVNFERLYRENRALFPPFFHSAYSEKKR